MISDTVGDWQELSALYERADALDRVALAKWLAQLRSDEHPLLAQLERMLDARAYVVGGDFLKVLPRIDLTVDTPLDPVWALGDRIGAYRLGRHIGSGGMAEVWLAERVDGAFERTVAIKLLDDHPARGQREAYTERFKRERDILATLSHPHIAGLLDAGVTPEGQPWLALEYVEGESIALWCDRQRLDIRQRLEVFRQVLTAVEFAHAKLVLHRDLKPSNVLVTPDGTAKLLDFGIAKLLSDGATQAVDSLLTSSGGRPLTLQYASPEQVQGLPLSTASDVYSLTMILYELLCGERPYDLGQRGSLEAAQVVMTVEPRLPGHREISAEAAQARGSTPIRLAKTLRADLDAIVSVGLQKHPERRYPSVEAMRRDIDRWLNGQPVRARKPTVAYHVSKFVSRHRVAVSLSVVAVSIIVATAAVAVIKEYRARDESARALAARDFVLDLLRMTDPQRSRGTGVDSKRVLETGRSDALEKLQGQPDLLSDVLSRIAKMQRYVGDYRGALVTLEDLIRVRRAQGNVREAAMARIDMADNAYSMGDTGRTSRLLAEVRGRVDASPNDDAMQAKFLLLRGLVLRREHDFENARIAMEESLRRSIRAFGETDTYTLDVSLSLVELATVARRYEAGRAILSDASNRASRSTNAGERDLIGIEIYRTRLEEEAGQFDLARRIGLAATVNCKAQLGENTEDCLILEDLTIDALLHLGLFDDASLLALRLDTLMGSAREESPARRAERVKRIGRALGATGRIGERPAIRRELESVADSASLAPLYKVDALSTLAEIDLRDGDGREAEALANRALVIASDGPNPDRQKVGLAMTLIGIAMTTQGRYPEAARTFDNANLVLAATLGREHPLSVLLRVNALTAFRHELQWGKATEICKDAETILAPSMGVSAPAFNLVRTACRLSNTITKPSRPEPPALLL